MAKRQLSEQAQCAKEIRQTLKQHGIKCRVTSEGYSMGDNVKVTVYDQPPWIMEKIESELSKYQYGHFDGMQDYYEMSNRRDDIPQTKYLFIRNEFSKELEADAWRELCGRFDSLKGKENIDPDSCFNKDSGEWGSQLLYRYLNGSMAGDCYFKKPKKRLTLVDINKPATPETGAGVSDYEIKEVLHTKKQKTIYICVPGARLDRDQFEAERERAKTLGGWYSRKFGASPAGFGFNDAATAADFAGKAEKTPETTKTTVSKSQTKKEKPRSDIADEIEAIADKMQKAIDDCFADRLSNTPKRYAQMMRKQQEGHQLQRAQKLLFALAEQWKSGAMKSPLDKIRSRAAAVRAVASKLEPVANGFHAYHIETNEPANDDPLTLAAWNLLNAAADSEPTQQQQQAAIKVLEGQAQNASIAGYYPTPDPVIDLMLSFVDITSFQRVLEPSAGKGNIADRARLLCAQVECFEVSPLLREILESKNHKVLGGDFLEATPDPVYDFVLMNPPFEKLQDIDHIMHAYKFLQPGGELVAICSPAVFFHQSTKAQMGREWLEMRGAHSVDLMPGSFKSSGTNVNAKLIYIRKPE